MGRATTKFWSMVRRKAPTVETNISKPQNQQLQCAFLSVLPYEIRALIYESIYCDLYIHLTDLGIHLAHIVHKDPAVLSEGSTVLRHDSVPGTENHWPLPQDRERSKDQLLALSISCQRM